MYMVIHIHHSWYTKCLLFIYNLIYNKVAKFIMGSLNPYKYAKFGLITHMLSLATHMLLLIAHVLTSLNNRTIISHRI